MMALLGLASSPYVTSAVSPFFENYLGLKWPKMVKIERTAMVNILARNLCFVKLWSETLSQCGFPGVGVAVGVANWSMEYISSIIIINILWHNSCRTTHITNPLKALIYHEYPEGVDFLLLDPESCI